ncbi:hypothetical protein L6452_00150 [Arctium lappa]|uniref:Uncharacterized protein n=1 Tax=Arctium lappa TaxID=4217 RepID=A0ACB9FD68_ARCLA|nr:hypothetical protein L6452_00150 [Arctium lappa]
MGVLTVITVAGGVDNLLRHPSSTSKRFTGNKPKVFNVGLEGFFAKSVAPTAGSTTGVLIPKTEEAEKTEMIPSIKRSNSTPESVSDDVHIPAIRKFFRDKTEE